MTIAPDMLSQFGGVPVASAGYTNPWSSVFFVDGISGTAGGQGTSPDTATLTVSQAITLASAGDVIYIRQLAPLTSDPTDPTPYTDNWLIPYAKWGMSLIGTGNNPHQPFYCQIKPGTAGYGVEIKAASTTIENLDFNKGSATTGLIFFSGDVNSTDLAWGTLISNCHIRNADSAANGGIKTYAGSYNTVYHSFFTGCHTSIYINSGGTYPVRAFTIDRCTFHPGNATTAGGSDVHVGGGSVVYELEIKNCNFTMLPTGKFTNIGAGTYGVIQNCYFGDLDTTCGTSGDITVPVTVFVSGCFDDGSQIDTT